MKAYKMKPLNSFELTVRSMVIRGEKANKGLDATAAPNPNQMNRLVGYLDDGTQVVVAQRPGKGGMDFNKLLGGKVYAVAADGISPVYEKGPDNKPTKKQKIEEGKPLYSSSGFYLLSSKEYPALRMMEAYTLLRDKGEQVLLVTNEQLEATKQKQVLTSEMDFDLLSYELQQLLDDKFNLVAEYDEGTNKKRKRGIERAKEEADDTGDAYSGVEFNELAVSKKDGNPFILFAWKTIDGPVVQGFILREAILPNDEDRPTTHYFTAEEAMQHFANSAECKKLIDTINAGKQVEFGFVQGHAMRTSVSFKRKAENVLAAPDKPQYGDAVYIHAALKAWTKGLVSLMQSQHPNFPNADYDAHHYVAACRQAEIGMNKIADNKWSPPVALTYDLAKQLLT